MHRLSYLLSMVALSTAFVACGGDSVTGLSGVPDDPECVQGVLDVSATLDTTAGHLGASSCSVVDSVTNGTINSVTTSYDAYGLSVRAGTAYILTVHPADASSTADYTLQLWGSQTGGSMAQNVATSPGGGGGTANADPQLYFVAPQTGTYALRVLGATAADTGAYVLTTRTCPVRARITGTDAFSDSAQLQSADCVINDPRFITSGNDSAHVAFYTIHMEANSERVITVTSAAFGPSFFAGGPGFDARCYSDRLCGGSALADGSTTASDILVADVAGEYTLALGARTHTGVGGFKLTIGAAEPIPAPRRVASHP